MGWFASLGVAAITGVLGLVLAGLVALGCVSWYRISGFEGKSGYFVVAIALLGGVAGVVLSLVVARIVGTGADPSFLKALGIACGSVAVLAGIATLVCRGLADIPPQIDGKDLRLAVEVRLPAGELPPPPSDEQKSSISLGSVVSSRRRSVWSGTLDVTQARQVDGQWVIPGSVFVYTRRGMRLLQVELAGTWREGFAVPLPANPTSADEAWSEWLPRRGADGGAWPATKLSYRYRVERIEPDPPPPDPEDVAAGRFAALATDAPLAEWLEFADVDATEERAAAIQRVSQERPAELAELIGGEDEALRERALEVVGKLAAIDPAVLEAVQAEGRAIADAIGDFNSLPADHPRFYDVQLDLRSRFTAWKHAWWNVHRRLGLDGRPPAQAIHDLAQVRTQGTSMDEIVVNARVILEALPPGSPAPP